MRRSPEDTSPYGVEQSEDGLSTSNAESSGKKPEKDLKPRSLKGGDMSEPLSQYDLNSYPSKNAIREGRVERKITLLLAF